MGLTVEDVNAVVAQWEEWTADAGFALSIEVLVDDVKAELADAIDSGALMANISSDSRYVQVQIRRGGHLVFDQRVPYDAAMLRASVTTLARYLASLRQEAPGTTWSCPDCGWQLHVHHPPPVDDAQRCTCGAAMTPGPLAE